MVEIIIMDKKRINNTRKALIICAILSLIIIYMSVRLYSVDSHILGAYPPPPGRGVKGDFYSSRATPVYKKTKSTLATLTNIATIPTKNSHLSVWNKDDVA